MCNLTNLIHDKLDLPDVCLMRRKAVLSAESL